jgi:hypothetical protein
MIVVVVDPSFATKNPAPKKAAAEWVEGKDLESSPFGRSFGKLVFKASIATFWMRAQIANPETSIYCPLERARTPQAIGMRY